MEQSERLEQLIKDTMDYARAALANFLAVGPGAAAEAAAAQRLITELEQAAGLGPTSG